MCDDGQTRPSRDGPRSRHHTHARTHARARPSVPGLLAGPTSHQGSVLTIKCFSGAWLGRARARAPPRGLAGAPRTQRRDLGPVLPTRLPSSDTPTRLSILAVPLTDALWPPTTRLAIRQPGREAHPHPGRSSSSSLCPWPCFKPLEATSLWPAQTLGAVSIGSLCLPGRPRTPSRAAEAPTITPMLLGCLDAVLKLEWSPVWRGCSFRIWSR